MSGDNQEAIYTSEKHGNDETGDGTEKNPFKTILQAMRKAGAEPFPAIHVDGKEDGVQYEVAAKSQLKKIQKIWVREQYKQADKSKKDDEDAERRAKNIEDAKKVVIEEDKALPAAQRVKIVQTDGIDMDMDLRQPVQEDNVTSMEIDLAADISSSTKCLRALNCEIKELSSNGDITTTKAILEVGDYSVGKLPDINQLVKEALEGLRSKDIFKELTEHAIEELMRYFRTALVQNKGKHENLAVVLQQIPNHAFNDHRQCGDWCDFRENEENCQMSLFPEGSDVLLHKTLTNLFNKLAAETDKLAENYLEQKQTMMQYEQLDGVISYQTDVEHIIREAEIVSSSSIDPLEDPDEVVVLFDLETSGFESDAQILQLAAKCSSNIFSTYVTPIRDISPAASQVNDLTWNGLNLFYLGNIVQTVPIEDCLRNFYDFLLSAGKPCVLVAHNCQFDSSRLFQAISRAGMKREFSQIISGFTDTLQIFREIRNPPCGHKNKSDCDLNNCIREKKKCSLGSIATDCQVSTEGSHDAVADVQILDKILKAHSISDKVLVERKKCLETFFSEQKKRELIGIGMKTLSPLAGVVSEAMLKRVATAEMDFNRLIDMYLIDDGETLRGWFAEPINGKPRITRSTKVIKSVLHFFKSTL